jgi:hypothetical protein
MNRFMTLFWSYRELSPGEQQRAVHREFPAVVAQSPFRLWRPGDSVPGNGIRIRIGVATWSGYDMRLLDVLAEGVLRAPAPAMEVFDTADCCQQADFEKYIPDIGDVYQTPVVGIWQDGRLEWSGQGYEARERVARMFGSSSDEIVAFVMDRINAQRIAPTS